MDFQGVEKMVKKALLIIMLFLFILVTGCQTMRGVGGDIRWMAGARDDNKSENK
jgi:predicted small secreted protein